MRGKMCSVFCMGLLWEARPRGEGFRITVKIKKIRREGAPPTIGLKTWILK